MDETGPEEWQSPEAFFRFQLAVGRVLHCEPNPKARKPAYVLEVDFGPYGVKRSSAQLTRRYRPEELVGRQVVAVLNFPPKRVAGVVSEVLVLGAMPEAGDVVLLQPDRPVAEGTLIG